jgi:fucose 4-O-acetylase-like acetyltransferase
MRWSEAANAFAWCVRSSSRRPFTPSLGHKDTPMTPRPAAPVEAARGLMLLGVFHIHALYACLDHLGDGGLARQAQWQIKALAPHVVLYFALAGMTSRSLADKAWPVVLQRSLMLLLVALFSHAPGVLLQYALWKPWTSAIGVLAEIARPIVDGTGYSTFVAWFFVVLAITRLFAFAFAKGWRYSMAALGGAAVCVVAARWLGLADNFYEWRNWPAALALFVLGTRIAPTWRVPHAVGALSAAAGLALPLINRPALWSEGPCWTCDAGFVAQPMVGGYGFMPLYFAQEGVAVIGLLWLSQAAAALPVGRFLAYVGRRSLPLLVLHGWVILSLYGLAAYAVPRSAGVWLFVAIVIVNTALHLALYRLLTTPLDRFVALCSATSRWMLARLRIAPAANRRNRVTTPPR